MPSLMKKIRYRGVSVESVILGIVVVLAFAGSMYFIFDWIRERDTRHKYRDHFFSVLQVTQTSAKENSVYLGPDDMFDMEKGLNIVSNTLENPTVNSEIDLFPDYPGMFVLDKNLLVPYGGSVFSVSYGGSINATPSFRRAGLMINWSAGGVYGRYNEEKARRLCRFLAEGSPSGTFQGNQLLASSFKSGSLGDNYQISHNGCDENVPSIFLIFKF